MIVQQVGLEFHTCTIVARKLSCIKFVYYRIPNDCLVDAATASAFPTNLHGLGRDKFTFNLIEVYSAIFFLNWSEYC